MRDTQAPWWHEFDANWGKLHDAGIDARVINCLASLRRQMGRLEERIDDLCADSSDTNWRVSHIRECLEHVVRATELLAGVESNEDAKR